MPKDFFYGDGIVGVSDIAIDRGLITTKVFWDIQEIPGHPGVLKGKQILFREFHLGGEKTLTSELRHINNFLSKLDNNFVSSPYWQKCMEEYGISSEYSLHSVVIPDIRMGLTAFDESKFTQIHRERFDEFKIKVINKALKHLEGLEGYSLLQFGKALEKALEGK